MNKITRSMNIFGQAVQNVFRSRLTHWKVEMPGCIHCGKICDPELGDEYIIWGCDGDYVCSKECEEAERRQMDLEFGGGSESLRIIREMELKVKEESEPKRPFNRYTALIDAE